LDEKIFSKEVEETGGLVRITPPTTRLSAQTVGGGPGLAVNPGEEDADSAVLPATATEYSPKAQSPAWVQAHGLIQTGGCS